MARFNRHRPALCSDCRAPLSVKERRASEMGEMLCAWDRNEHLRAALAKLPTDSFWISEPSEVTFHLPDEEPVTVEVDPWVLFGYDDDGET